MIDSIQTMHLREILQGEVRRALFEAPSVDDARVDVAGIAVVVADRVTKKLASSQGSAARQPAQSAVSLAVLEAARVGMSDPSCWQHDERDPRSVAIMGSDVDSTFSSCDARGLVATIRASGPLIAFARAMLEWDAAQVAIDGLPVDADPRSEESMLAGSAVIAAYDRVRGAMGAVRL